MAGILTLSPIWAVLGTGGPHRTPNRQAFFPYRSEMDTPAPKQTSQNLLESQISYKISTEGQVHKILYKAFVSCLVLNSKVRQNKSQKNSLNRRCHNLLTAQKTASQALWLTSEEFVKRRSGWWKRSPLEGSAPGPWIPPLRETPPDLQSSGFYKKKLKLKMN